MNQALGLSLAVVTMVTGLTYSSDLRAVEAMQSVELASHCNLFDDPSAEADRIFCTRYVQGFIDGAVATDARVTKNVADEFAAGENYGQRAARTRIGTRLQRYGNTTYAEFCLGEPVPLKEVVMHVVEALGDDKLVVSQPLARDLVYTVLRNDYPCEVKD